MAEKLWDVIIAGGGPAGLSAALVLGRCRRSVLICDTNTPRSWASKEMHGFLTRDAIHPDRFREMGREDLARYPSVQFVESQITDASRRSDGTFAIVIGHDRIERCRKFLIATGLLDELPRIEGIVELFGRSVFQCPYCDGWEMRNEDIAVYGKRQRGMEMARAMTAWTDDIALLTDGPSGLSAKDKDHLKRNGVTLYEERVSRLDGTDGHLHRIIFQSGTSIERTAMFFDTPTHPQSHLAEKLGCHLTRTGGVKCGKYEATSVPGVFVAGNLIKDVQLVIVAAAEGTRAAFGINRSLTREDFARKATGALYVEHPPVEDADVQRRRPDS
jgi:thioredoxin reductase